MAVLISPHKSKKLPHSFKRLLWAYDFRKLNSEKNKKTIILSVINYGDLSEWRLLKKLYGPQEIKKILCGLRPADLRAGARKLAYLIMFSK